MRQTISVDLGPLLAPLRVYCESRSLRPSDAVRRAVARLLRVEGPEMRGQVANLRQYQKRPRKNN